MSGRGAAAPRPARRAAAGLVAALALAGGGLVVRGLWIPAKAVAAQVLLEGAWRRARAGGVAPRPWPWADTWPVGRLGIGDGPTLVVLAGATGRSLAFGPGHVDGTALPGEPGNVVLAGHRDTVFRRLAGLRPGDEIRLEGADGSRWRYRVVDTRVRDHRDTAPLAPSDHPRLTLITCWPFDALVPGGPQRFVVTADGARAGPPLVD